MPELFCDKDMADDFIDLTDPAAAKVREQLPPEGDGGALRLAVKRLENGDFHYAMGFDLARACAGCAGIGSSRSWMWRSA